MWRGGRGERRRGVKFAKNGLTFNSTPNRNRRGSSIGEVKSVLEIASIPATALASLKSSPTAMTESFVRQLWKHAKILLVSQKKPLLPGNLMPIPTICLPRKLIPLPGCTLPPTRLVFSFFFFYFSFCSFCSLPSLPPPLTPPFPPPTVVVRVLWLESRLFRISFRQSAVISNSSFLLR